MQRFLSEGVASVEGRKGDGGMDRRRGLIGNVNKEKAQKEGKKAEERIAQMLPCRKHGVEGGEKFSGSR